jgi:CheY-like chemotaxis protein
LAIALVSDAQTSSSKVLLIQGEPAVNKVMGALLQGTTAPRVAILVNSCSELLTELLRRDGYDASLLTTSNQDVLETVLAKHPDLLLLDGAVLEILLQEVRGQTDQQTKMARENAARALEFERQAEQEEQKVADLMQRNTELETALVRAQRTIQNMCEIARRALASK